MSVKYSWCVNQCKLIRRSENLHVCNKEREGERERERERDGREKQKKQCLY